MSVRFAVTEEQIREAEAIYKAIREGAAYKVSGGRIIRPGLLGIKDRLAVRLDDLSFTKKLLFPLVLSAAVAGVGAYWQLYALYNDTLEQAGHQNAKTLIDAARNARTFYNEHVVTEAANAGLIVSDDYAEQPGTVPLPAAFMRHVGELASEDQKSELRVYSASSFASRGNASRTQLDSFEKSAAAFLEENPGDHYAARGFQDGEPVYRLAVADVMTHQSCVNCHNSQPGALKTDWSLGDVRGVIQATVSLDQMQNAFVRSMIATGLGLGSIFLGTVFLILGAVNYQRKRLNQVNSIARAVSNGELRFPIPLGGRDEVGDTMNRLTVMRNRLYEMVFQMNKASGELSDKTLSLSRISKITAEGALEQSDASMQIASALEQLNASTEQINESASSAHNQSINAGQAALAGASSVDDSTEVVRSMASTIEEADHELQALNRLSEEITKNHFEYPGCFRAN